ncbi:CIC11C00000003343 [Sungouiella intermedia]|uniref:CIC11C00000003343 n=2 Tax=Sungouiella intermedia TaxID=45354 RepID=A0A1L0G0L9_9ASCO|nr:CIC11C00000003343 [[Candida] intermedia]
MNQQKGTQASKYNTHCHACHERFASRARFPGDAITDFSPVNHDSSREIEHRNDQTDEMVSRPEEGHFEESKFSRNLYGWLWLEDGHRESDAMMIQARTLQRCIGCRRSHWHNTLGISLEKDVVISKSGDISWLPHVPYAPGSYG